MSQLDVDKWVEKSSSSESIIFEQSTPADSTDSLTTKSSDDVSNTDSADMKSYETSSTKSSEDEKRLQKHKKDILHRDIEKRRRDRINSSLTELRDLVPSAKLKLKNDGSNRTGRLQKARLLELTVEYLKSLKQPDKSSGASDAPPKKEDIQNALITESAQQIYVQAYKSGFCDAVKEVTKSLPPQKSKEGLSVHLKNIDVPPIFLLSESGKEKSHTSQLLPADGKLIKGKRKTVNETFSSSYEHSSVIKDIKGTPSADFQATCRTRSASVDGASTISLYDQNFSQAKRGHEFENNGKNPSFDARSFSERSPVLISSYVLNEDKTQYHPTVLPLNVILEEAMKYGAINKPLADIPPLYEKPAIGLKRPPPSNDYSNETRSKLYVQENKPRTHSSVNEDDLNFLKSLHAISKEELLKFQADLRSQFY